jgi:hypothetical protein
MKKGFQIKWLGGIFVGILALAIAANHFVRVTYSPSRSVGIINHLLYGHLLAEAFGQGMMSENFRRWDYSAKASSDVADLIIKYGAQELLFNPDREALRRQAQQLSEAAYLAASAIPKEYLANSNPELPDAYSTHFVPALRHWHRGFAEKDIGAVQQGISDYNTFLRWMQSHKHSDFKNIR